MPASRPNSGFPPEYLPAEGVAATIDRLDNENKRQLGGYNAFDRFDEPGRLRHGGTEYAELCPNPDSGGAAGATSGGRNARRDSLRHSLWPIDRARTRQAGDGRGRSRGQAPKLEDEHRR